MALAEPAETAADDLETARVAMDADVDLSVAMGSSVPHPPWAVQPSLSLPTAAETVLLLPSTGLAAVELPVAAGGAGAEAAAACSEPLGAGAAPAGWADSPAGGGAKPDAGGEAEPAVAGGVGDAVAAFSEPLRAGAAPAARGAEPAAAR